MTTIIFYPAKRLVDHRNYCYDRFVFELYTYNINKVGLSPSQKIGFISFNENPLEMIKNTLFHLKRSFSFSRYLNFCLDFFVI